MTGQAAAENRFEALRAGDVPLVGREAEMELLSRVWERARSGDGQVVVVRGEAGIGKSRLVAAFRDWLTNSQASSACAATSMAPIVLAFHGSPNHTNSALYPIARQLERLAAFERGVSDTDKRSKLSDFLERCSSGQADTLALFADLLGNRSRRWQPCSRRDAEVEARAHV